MSGNPKRHDGLPAGLSDVGNWYVSEFRNDEENLAVRGHFNLSPFQKLTAEQTQFLTTFLRCRGVIASVEKELGISYPTVRSRLDQVLAALGLAPAPETAYVNNKQMSQKQKEILAKLESGEITAEQAKQEMKEAAK
jgi:hypothetical protein